MVLFLVLAKSTINVDVQDEVYQRSHGSHDVE